MLCGQIQSFYSCLGKVLSTCADEDIPGVLWLVSDFLESEEGGGLQDERLVGVSLADLFLFVPYPPPPSPTQRLDCTTLQS